MTGAQDTDSRQTGKGSDFKERNRDRRPNWRPGEKRKTEWMGMSPDTPRSGVRPRHEFQGHLFPDLGVSRL